MLTRSFRSEAEWRGLQQGRDEAALVARTSVEPLLDRHRLGRLTTAEHQRRAPATLVRPRRLQGHQRHARPPHRRPALTELAARLAAGVRPGDTSLDHYDASSLTLAGELRRAIDGEQLVLHYQPQAGLRDGAVNSLEAVVRRRHPTVGLLYPDRFLALAQRTDLIDTLTGWVLHRALRDLGRLDAVSPGLSVAVNVSARSVGPRRIRARRARHPRARRRRRQAPDRRCDRDGPRPQPVAACGGRRRRDAGAPGRAQ